MNEGQLFTTENERPHSLTIRDIAQVGFRHQRAMLACFITLSLLALGYIFISPPKYESESKILVRRGRVDPVVSPMSGPMMMLREPITEEELNSEAELLLSDDVLQQVVSTVHLDHRKPLIPWLHAFRSTENRGVKVDVAARELGHELRVEPLKKTNVIEVTYRARDAELAAQVLRTLNSAYIQKHLAVHRLTGQSVFFEQKTDDYRDKLKLAEKQLQDFSREPTSVRPALVRDQMLQQLTTLNGSLNDTRAEIAKTENRIRTLEDEVQAIPQRMTTAVRRLDNAQLLQQMKSTLLQLELKRTELLSKFQKDYRPVQELEEEIRKTRASIAAEETSPLREDTTDADPTHTWVNGELARAKADLNGLLARAVTMEKTINQYHATVHELQNKGIVEQDLLRDVKSAEENYLLYLQKREEARINDALDLTHILNVTIAQEPTVPSVPLSSSWLFATMGVLAAAVISAGAAFTLDYFDSSFHTPSEIEMTLNIPVLATVAYETNGTDNGHRSVNSSTSKDARQMA